MSGDCGLRRRDLSIIEEVTVHRAFARGTRRSAVLDVEAENDVAQGGLPGDYEHG